MNFWQIFIHVFPHRPFPALGALWWHVTGKRLRARNRLRSACASLPFAYEFWIRNNERDALDKKSAADRFGSWARRPTFEIVLDMNTGSVEAALRTVRSIEAQSYPNWSITILGPEAPRLEVNARLVRSWQAALSKAHADFIVPVEAGDQLSADALTRFGEALQSERSAAIVYGDEDRIDGAGRRHKPWFKPRWNEEYFLANDYVSKACAIRTQDARSIAQRINRYSQVPVLEILLQILENVNGPIIHVPHVVAHVDERHCRSLQLARAEAVDKYAARNGGTAGPGAHGTVKVSWPLPVQLPLVSVIIPTKDKVELLRACVDSVLTLTTYVPYEILIVDNGSVESRTIQYLNAVRADPRVEVLPYPLRYNYSAINNHAAGIAKGSYLCLLNNDTEVIEPDWLTEMMRYGARAEIGAVGAKLLYSDGTIQHAGVVVGIGDAAGHAHRNLPANDRGYFCQAHIPQYVSAVTGACLLVEKSKFMDVGGLDEERLPIAFNDVDLCLKLQAAGWRNVYVPHAVLIHHESKSREKDHASSQIDRYRRELKVFQDRWCPMTYDDPIFNPNLDRANETFIIRL